MRPRQRCSILAFVCALSSSVALAADGGSLADGGASDAGAADAGDRDAGAIDAGDHDAGALDAGALDAGVVDAGAPLFDAGPQLPDEEGRGCTPGDGANCGSLYCVPYPGFPTFGICRTGCEDNDDCFPGRSCTDVVDVDTFETLYRACVPPVSWRDGECLAPGDPDACANDMSCHIARSAASPDGPSFNCKVTCDLDAAPDAGACPTDERCFSSRYVQGYEAPPGDPDGVVNCTPALCADDGAGCECGDDFTCVQLASGNSVCAFVPGECGTPVRGLMSGELADGGLLPFDVQCNTATAHRFCDNEPFEGLPNPGANLCIFEGELGVPDEGICVPYCGVASVDVNGNGALEPGEVGAMFDCPQGEQCTRRLARELYLGPGPQQAGGPYGLRGCSVAACPAGTVCESCGPGQPECMGLPSPVGGFDGICVGPVFTCEYAPDYDAGPSPFVDAGNVAVDAGASVDAGDPPAGADAGTNGRHDAGPGGGGLIEPAGPTVTADGCACASSRTSTSSWPAGVVALLFAAAPFARRRRNPLATSSTSAASSSCPTGSGAASRSGSGSRARSCSAATTTTCCAAPAARARSGPASRCATRTTPPAPPARCATSGQRLRLSQPFVRATNPSPP